MEQMGNHSRRSKGPSRSCRVKHDRCRMKDRLIMHIVLLNDHGRHYWLTPGQWEMFHGLMQPLGYTVPAIVLGGLFLSHVLNVKLFPFLGGMGALFSRNDSP